MTAIASRFAALLAALWVGVLLALGALVAPALFASLPPADAGRIAGRLFAAEAYGSVAVAVALIVVERARWRERESTAGDPAGGDSTRGESIPSESIHRGSTFSAELALALGIVACTVAGYFAVQPMMEAARADRGSVPFGTLHAISGGFFVLRGLLLMVLAWRLTGQRWLAFSRRSTPS